MTIPSSTHEQSKNKPWQDRFQRLIGKALGADSANELWQKYHTAFTSHYKALVSPRYALQDLLYLEQIKQRDEPLVNLIRPGYGSDHYRLHFYSQQERYLDEYLPVLENIGLRVMDQVQFPIPVDGYTLFIKSFTIKAAKSQYDSFRKLRRPMLATIQAVMTDKMENDSLNKLTVLSGMAWQAIDLLRAYRNYFLQLNHHTSRASIHRALINNPEVALYLFNYFEARFRPDPAWDDALLREEQSLMPLRLQLLNSLAEVADLNDDRILRTLFNLIDATMRSNYHLRRDLPDYFIAFKINSLGIIDMPAPKPQYEIYVHSVAMEGIHLRGGKISRGGIRWSDRLDDFRTEILGLMQTQISKNALIIPTGAKGGFVVKKNGGTDDFKTAGKKAYLTLICGLLDLTDNYQDDDIIPLPELVTYDDPDPYLVVAADKGTAQFSDIANGVAADYQFWLGDAFASGGSRGYDHKALGITARGAWECVKRHFRELGKDIQHETFTVVGIGSMDGDVFGNGMLLSPCIRLVAAFSGQHIFLDPNPPADDSAFNERRRLFELPGSSWNDYDRTLISKGGGVFLRADKNIVVSGAVRKWLGIRYPSLDGESLIRYLLMASVDLLWLGGIGTYVKAVSEKHEEVGDRNNDNVRINAAELKATVVGEGANLGFTQKARIEYALRGGRINTDAVDNSAGVDTSDHEVNLKILLMRLHKQKLIADYQPLFTGMTTEVCRLVLANNIAQSLCLSLEQLRCNEDSSMFLPIAERLEASGFLDRAVESFPQNKEILARPGKILTRPEVAVLMAVAKMYLTQQIQDQIALLHDDCCNCYLEAYFPEQLTEQYKNQLTGHPLATQIKATMVSNKIINQAGCSFLALDIDNDNPNLLDHVSCYLAFDRLLEGDALRRIIAASDNKIAADKQYQLLLQLEKTLAEFCRWTLGHGLIIRPDQPTMTRYSSYLNSYRQAVLQPAYQQAGITDELEQKMLLISHLNDFPLLVSLCIQTGQDFLAVVKLFNELTAYLGLDSIYECLSKLPIHDAWERKLLPDLPDTMKRVTSRLVKTLLVNNTTSCTDYFELPAEKQKMAHYRRIYQEIINAPPVNLLPYVVLAKELERLVDGVDF